MVKLVLMGLTEVKCVKLPRADLNTLYELGYPEFVCAEQGIKKSSKNGRL